MATEGALTGLEVLLRNTGKMKDDSLIEVVGAGPAGLAAAIALARAGRSVDILKHLSQETGK
ncbi:MAG: NAD(P)-binding protein [Pseudomonadota bacterium]